MNIRASAMFNMIRYYEGIDVDITERKKAEAALRERRALPHAIENPNDGVAIIQGYTSTVNRRFEMFEFLHRRGHRRRSHHHPSRRSLESAGHQGPAGSSPRYEFHWVLAKGMAETIYVEVSASHPLPIAMPPSTPCLSPGRVTERKEAEGGSSSSPQNAREARLSAPKTNSTITSPTNQDAPVLSSGA